MRIQNLSLLKINGGVLSTAQRNHRRASFLWEIRKCGVTPDNVSLILDVGLNAALHVRLSYDGQSRRLIRGGTVSLKALLDRDFWLGSAKIATLKMTTLSLPQKLSNSPLRETIFEMRFEPVMAAAGDILPGLLYSSLKSEYPEVVPLPLASVPRSIREKTPELVYQYSHSLRGSTSSVQLGDRVLAFHVMEYPGWATFRGKIESLIKSVKETGLVKHVERFSFKYVNLIETSTSESQLKLMNLKVELVGHAPVERGFQLRVENEEGKFTTITQISPNTTAKIPSLGKEVAGLLVDVDTIRFSPEPEFWITPGSFLDQAHLIAKIRFFSLLTDSAMRKLEPVW